MRVLLDLMLRALQVYTLHIIATAILSWVRAFIVLIARNYVVGARSDFLYRVTEPALRPIRRILPNLGGIDVSPIILLLGIFFLQRIITHYLYPAVF